MSIANKKYYEYIHKHRIKFGNYYYPFKQKFTDKEDKFKFWFIDRTTPKFIWIRFRNNKEESKIFKFTKEDVFRWIDFELNKIDKEFIK